MEFVDTHCHIQSAGAVSGEQNTRELWGSAADLTAESMASEAHIDGVTRLIAVGCTVEDSQLAVNFSADHDGCWASIGIHPHEAKHYEGNEGLLQQFAALATEQKVVAIGECGLDFFYTHSPKEAQITMLHYQLRLAQQHDLPVIFHVRNAFDDFWPLFDTYKNIRGVLHSFTDTQENMQRAIDRGLYIGVNGIATFTKQASQLAMYAAIPSAHLLLETDAPFLTPTPYRGKINQPKYVRKTAEFLAALREGTVGDLAETTTANARQLFKI